MFDLTHQKILVSICSNLSCLSTCKKSTEQTCYFRYLGMPGHTHLKWCINLKKPSTFISWQKINFILDVFLEILQRYCKLVVFGTLGLSGYAYPKSFSRKRLCLSGGKKSTSSPMLLWEHSKDMQTYFGYFGHALLHSPKIMVSPCRRLRCLSACKKINFIIHFFLMVLHFKESCNLIGWQHFGP